MRINMDLRDPVGRFCMNKEHNVNVRCYRSLTQPYGKIINKHIP